MNYKVLFLTLICAISALNAHDHTTVIIEKKDHKKTTVIGDTCRVVVGSGFLALATALIITNPVITDQKFRAAGIRQEINKLTKALSTNPSDTQIESATNYLDNLIKLGVIVSSVGAPIASYFGVRLLKKGLKGFSKRKKKAAKNKA